MSEVFIGKDEPFLEMKTDNSGLKPGDCLGMHSDDLACKICDIEEQCLLVTIKLLLKLAPPVLNKTR